MLRPLQSHIYVRNFPERTNPIAFSYDGIKPKMAMNQESCLKNGEFVSKFLPKLHNPQKKTENNVVILSTQLTKEIPNALKYKI